MSDERIITAAIVITDEKADGHYLEKFYEKSIVNGFKTESVIGDAAYSGKDNIQFSRTHKFHLVAKLNTAVSNGSRKNKKHSTTIKILGGMFVLRDIRLSERQNKEQKEKKESGNGLSF